MHTHGDRHSMRNWQEPASIEAHDTSLGFSRERLNDPKRVFDNSELVRGAEKPSTPHCRPLFQTDSHEPTLLSNEQLRHSRDGVDSSHDTIRHHSQHTALPARSCNMTMFVLWCILARSSLYRGRSCLQVLLERLPVRANEP